MYRGKYRSYNICAFAAAAVIIMAACSNNGNTWESTISRQQQAPGSLPKIDSVIVRFMYKYNIPGMSVALAKDGQLFYAKGYGYADRTNKKEVTTESLFRVGDISCTITAMAIMKLIAQGKLTMASRIFGDSGILANKYGTPPYSKGIAAITVNDLLQHTAGGWGDNNDPIFLPVLRTAAVDRARMLGVTLDNVPLQSPPGKHFAFSRFGYFILGMVIEKVSGQPYADFVTQYVLQPAGIHDMCITGDTESGKKKNEVICYKEDTHIPFSSDALDDDFYLSRSAACAGWLASAKDLIQLINANILDSATKKLMFTTSPLNPHYACGWSLSGDLKNWYCISQIFGSTSEIARLQNGYSWALLINTFRPVANRFMPDVDHLMWQALADGGYLPK